MEQAARGKKALSDGDYAEAITAYTAALKTSPTSPDYLIQRSTAYHRTKQSHEALFDSEQAVVHAEKRAKRELIIDAQFRRGCALYSLGRYGDAAFVFAIVERMHPEHKMVSAWTAKVGMATNDLDEGDDSMKCTVTEIPEESSKRLADKTEIAAITTREAPPQQTPADKIRYEWYQNSEKMFFTLLAKGVPQDQAQVDIQERSLSISFPLNSGSSYDLTIEPLFAAVKPDSCTTRILSTKVEVVLVKQSPGKWSALEGSDSVDAQAVAGAEMSCDSFVKEAIVNDKKPAGPVYPTSAKSGPKNWDKITKGLRLRNDSKSTVDNDDGAGCLLDDDDDYDYRAGNEADLFFMRLYKNASPDVKRAMNKSHWESNGTALSTDWNDTKKGPVETFPPDGMVAKNYDG